MTKALWVLALLVVGSVAYLLYGIYARPETAEPAGKTEVVTPVPAVVPAPPPSPVVAPPVPVPVPVTVPPKVAPPPPVVNAPAPTPPAPEPRPVGPPADRYVGQDAALEIARGNTSPDARREALNWLAFHGGHEAVSLIRQIESSDSDPGVRQEARNAAEALNKRFTEAGK